ncbi:DUF6241 domain-containing protein [Salipaludibacillus daqingensis]|uniref:DUF6241 domain-containing protein n=1 Tax=Salipaludibacillus daqingensis TaxID=3041001 RepID=UPI002476F707|nr:DUF6241 domain-containing protein [Salipaludibacillus daqingensis]
MLITDERIERLIEVIKDNSENDFNHSNLYLTILERWKQGDFSKVDEDHNDIWRLQGGTIGKATGILSNQEEQEFINTHFD